MIYLVVFVVLIAAFYVFPTLLRKETKRIVFISQIFWSALWVLSIVLTLVRGRVDVSAVIAGCFALKELYFLWERKKYRQASKKWRYQREASPKTSMPEEEACSVLGIEKGASRQEIIAAYHRLMKTAHPDLGGSTEKAARINEARDVLLRHFH